MNMKEYFHLSLAMAYTLLESDKESFIANFAENYFLDSEAMDFIFPLLPDKEAFKDLILKADFGICPHCVMNKMDKIFSFDETNEIFAQKGLYDTLDMHEASIETPGGHFQNRLQSLVLQGKYLEEICLFFKEHKGNGNYYLAKAGYRDVLVKHGVWKALASSHSKPSLNVLLQHHKYEEILADGWEDGIKALWDNGLKHLVIEHFRRLDAETDEIGTLHNCVRLFFEHKEWDAFKGKENLLVESSHPSSALSVLAFLETKEGVNVQKFLELCYQKALKQNWSYKDVRVSGFWRKFVWQQDAWADLDFSPSADGVDIWIYKNLENEELKRKLYYSFPWYSKARRAAKNPNFPTTLAEIEKALKS